MSKPWLKSYPPGIPAEIPTPEFRSVREMMAFAFDEYAELYILTDLSRAQPPSRKL